MSYADEADLGTDAEFTRRLTAAITDESRSKIDDPLAAYVMRAPAAGAAIFMPFVSTAPGFGDKYATGGQTSITDADILSSVQASWTDVATVNHVPPDDPAPLP